MHCFNSAESFHSRPPLSQLATDKSVRQESEWWTWGTLATSTPPSRPSFTYPPFSTSWRLTSSRCSAVVRTTAASSVPWRLPCETAYVWTASSRNGSATSCRPYVGTSRWEVRKTLTSFSGNYWNWFGCTIELYHYTGKILLIVAASFVLLCPILIRHW